MRRRRPRRRGVVRAPLTGKNSLGIAGGPSRRFTSRGFEAMADEIAQPHDRLFRAVFSDTAEAATGLNESRSQALKEQLASGT